MISGVKRHVGMMLMLTGLLHVIYGLFAYASQLQPIVTEGLWSTVADDQWDRGTAFWYTMFGFLLMLFGYMVDWLIKKKGIAPPAIFGWMLLFICLFGAIVMPASGFWLGLPQAWLLLRM